MDLNKNIIKKTIFLEQRTSDKFSDSRKDKYINLFLTKTNEIFEYVDIQRDDKTFTIERQEINPYFIEYSFFDNTKRIGFNTSNDLKIEDIKYIRDEYLKTDLYENSNNKSSYRATNVYKEIHSNNQYSLLGFNINDLDKNNIDIQINSKIRVSNAGYYDGIYILNKIITDEQNNIKSFFVFPDRNLTSNKKITQDGNFYDEILPPNAKIDVIKDDMNISLKEVAKMYNFNNYDKDWDIKYWFDNKGYNEFKLDVDKQTNENGIDKLEKISKDDNSIISKSYFFPININK